MKALVMGYFQDSRGEWHQPGNVDDFPDEKERGELEGRGVIRIRTAMAEQPETRKRIKGK